MIKDNTLDIMIFDNSDWAGEKLVLSWITGGKLYQLFHGVEHYKGFSSWKETFEWINQLEPHRKINSIQYWGHGSSGAVWMNDTALNSQSVKEDSDLFSHLQNLCTRLEPTSLVWFRTCNTFAGELGHKFAKTFSNFLGCTVAAHTYVIGPWQSGLHTIKPDMEPSWPVEEGLTWSKPWTKNTIFCLTGKIPPNW